MMDTEDENEDPFTISNLWRPSKFGLHQLSPIEPLTWGGNLAGTSESTFETPLESLKQDGSLLFQLNVFGTQPLENLEIENENSTSESGSEADNRIKDNESSPSHDLSECDNVWELENLYHNLEAKPALHSWDSFSNPQFREPASAYLSEFGARGFDAALAHRATVSGLENSGRLVRPDIFLQALFRLGLGWSSMFFHYNEKSRAFEKSIKDIRVTGISLSSIDGLINDVSACGTNIKLIRTFLRVNPTLSNQPSSLSSLASGISFLIAGLERQLSARFTHDISLIQIQWLFRQCGSLVSVLAGLVTVVDRLDSDSDIISMVLEKCDTSVQQFPWMADILHELMCRTSRPWFNLVETWTGLQAEDSTFVRLIRDKSSFVGIKAINESGGKAASAPENEFVYNPFKMPSVIPPDQGRAIFETGKSLRLLARTQPDHPLARSRARNASENPRFDCAFTWQDIENIQQKAKEYEKRLRSAILRYNLGASTEEPGKLQSKEKLSEINSVSDTVIGLDCFKLMDLDQAADQREMTVANATSLEMDPLHQRATEPDYFNVETMANPQHSFGPPLSSAFYLSLAPTLSMQAQLVDFSCLRLLFKEHKLRYHLNLQWRFQLLGDGYFSSRLSHSLFDEEMDSAERKSGVARGGIRSGLRLGSRDNWPPASSELRLVLVGVLSECHNNGENIHLSSRRRTKDESDVHDDHKTRSELPGGLSFAIRELSGFELDKCKDSNAIEALDFLRLQYKPPWELECVITSTSLHKYDLLFKHLLRLKRMVAVTQGLVRDVTTRGSLTGDTRNIFQKLRVESHHFVMCLNEYTLQATIGSRWQTFDQMLANVEHHLDNNDIDNAMGVVESLPGLRETHELVLDQILFALLLSKEHEHAYALLMDSFTTILTFAPLSRLDGREGVRSQQNENMAYQLYERFRKQVGAFLRYVRSVEGTSRKSAYRSGATFHGETSFRNQNSGEDLLQQLVLMLSLREYY